MTAAELQTALAVDFAGDDLNFYPVVLNKDQTKGRAATYIDARAVFERLDAVLGVGGWSTAYRIIDPATKAVECTLSIRVEDEWVSRSDVGYPNEAADANKAEKEPLKAAYSDAIKRAAVQFGVGRGIYSLELERDWWEVDEYKKFKERPRVKGEKGRPAPQAARQQAQPAAAAHSPAQAPQPPATQPTAEQVAPHGFAPDGRPNYTAFLADMAKDGLQTADCRLVIVPKIVGRLVPSDITQWLLANPNETLVSLKFLVGELKAAGAMPAGG